MRWPEYNYLAVSFDGRPIGYGISNIYTLFYKTVMGKSEGVGGEWHGHVTVLTVSPAYRKLGIAKRLMNHLENVSDSGNMYFVDLFVRESNSLAINMYKSMGYSVYRRVIDYYSEPDEDAFDMRKRW